MGFWQILEKINDVVGIVAISLGILTILIQFVFKFNLDLYFNIIRILLTIILIVMDIYILIKAVKIVRWLIKDGKEASKSIIFDVFYKKLKLKRLLWVTIPWDIFIYFYVASIVYVTIGIISVVSMLILREGLSLLSIQTVLIFLPFVFFGISSIFVTRFFIWGYDVCNFYINQLYKEKNEPALQLIEKRILPFWGRVVSKGKDLSLIYKWISIYFKYILLELEREDLIVRRVVKLRKLKKVKELKDYLWSMNETLRKNKKTEYNKHVLYLKAKFKISSEPSQIFCFVDELYRKTAFIEKYFKRYFFNPIVIIGFLQITVLVIIRLIYPEKGFSSYGGSIINLIVESVWFLMTKILGFML